ncbi:transcription termination factor NusA [Neorickettsia helminthoeca str. Oregon]|uniref:Transcription termination/antitermination protein NusA n=1 Tax=Neorickettsia helminthoeca str. Oregon TaxID=1286528 RepID=X5HK48_9RICK|nr:transcription termination factor NusA [Neorickettsia helminthoeca]AHX11439.1 transcription termination factor NusA [Neorickettsia helminthoeca str. Oregon]
MSFSKSGLNNLQIVESINSVAEKEGLNPENLFQAIGAELAYEIGKRQYGDPRISVEIDRKSGEITISKRLLVVEDSEKDKMMAQLPQETQGGVVEEKALPIIHETQEYDDIIALSTAKLKYPASEPKPGDVVVERLPSFSSGYLIAKVMKPKIERLINSLVREKQYNCYKDRVGELIVGVVKKSIDFKAGSRSMIIDVGGAEGILPFSSLIKGESFRAGDRVRCVIQKVEYSLIRPQILLSRSSGNFVAELFAQQVPEVYDRVVEVKKVARDPGSRAKVAVFSSDRNVDPVGACIGMGGSRINAVANELNGEKIDVVEYSSDTTVFLVNALKPIKPVKIMIDEEAKRIELVVGDDNLSMVIGRSGQNIHLLSSLVGYRIEVLSDAEVSKKKMEEFISGTERFVEALNVEEVIAQLLVTEGFSTVKEIAECEVSRLAFIEGFDTDIAEEIKNRAVEYVNDQPKRVKALLEKYDANMDMLSLSHLEHEMLEVLLSSKLTSLEKVAELSCDELREIIGENHFDTNTVEQLIIKAREALGWL